MFFGIFQFVYGFEIFGVFVKSVSLEVLGVRITGGISSFITSKPSLWSRLLVPVMGHCLSKDQDDGDDSAHNVEFAGGNVHLITTKESWDQKIAESKRDGKIVIANFSATWCGPCRIISPFYVELSEKHPSIMFLTVDVDELTEFSTSWDIKATPTFFFLKDGQQIDKLVGANKPELEKKLIAILDSEAPTQV